MEIKSRGCVTNVTDRLCESTVRARMKSVPASLLHTSFGVFYLRPTDGGAIAPRSTKIPNNSQKTRCLKQIT